MALNATIYKFNIALSDLNRDYYDTLHLTVARHPSESEERMMARVVAYCICACEGLEFSQGLSTPDTPDIWMKNLNGEVALWIEIGEPSPDKLKKATHIADEVKVFSFNSKSNTWWARDSSKIKCLPIEVLQFCWEDIQALAGLLQRGMVMSVTISDNSAFITAGSGQTEINWVSLV